MSEPRYDRGMTDIDRHEAQVPALQRALAEANAGELDAGNVALAMRYAQLLDDAALADKYRRPVERLDEVIGEAVLRMPTTAADQVTNAWSKLRSALAEHSVASDLGPKYLAALTALGLTPASRSAKPAPGGEAATLQTPLQLLRDGESPWTGRSSAAS